MTAFAPSEPSSRPAETPPCPICGHAPITAPCQRCGASVHEIDGYHRIYPKRGFFPKDLLHGMTTVAHGAFALFSRPEFAGQLLVPFLLNGFLVAGLYFALFFGVQDLFASMFEPTGFASGIDSVAQGLAPFVLTVVAGILLAPTVFELIMLPFLEPLVQTAERIMAGPNMGERSGGSWRSMVSGTRATAKVLLIQLGALIPTLFVSLFWPPIGILLATFIAAVLAALAWFDIPFARREQTLRQRVAVLRDNPGRALGFGLGFQLCLTIPFTALLLTPAAAVATTILYFHLDKRRLGAPAPQLTEPTPEEIETARARDESKLI